MLTSSPDIFSLDFTVLMDISVPAPTVKFTNRSTGPNLPGCTWIFGVKTPNNTLVHYAAFPTPDVTGNWTTFTIPEAFPMPGKNIIWSGADYTFTVTVRDSLSHEFTLDKKANICRPNGNKTGSNYGLAIFEVKALCQDAKIYAQDNTDYSYKKSITPYLSLQKKFTLSYPQNEDGSQPANKVITDFSNALIPFTANGPGYTATLESIVQYQVTPDIILQVKYKDKVGFKVQCNFDLCALQCEIDTLAAKVKDNCDNDVLRKLTVINAKMSKAIIGKTQPLCNYDVGKLIDEIKEIGGFNCDCDCKSGVVPLLNAPASTLDCGSVVACIRGIFSQLDPKCLASQQTWTSLDLLGQMQLLINTITAPICGTCTAPSDLVYFVYSKQLHWVDTAGSTVWRIEVKRSTDASFTLYNSTLPVLVGPLQWQLDLTNYTFVSGATYIFRVSGQCANGTYSTPTLTGNNIPNPCFTIVNFDAVVS